jgi:predicted AlkP superfamily phosphohydrolase/phosphomutase
MVIGDLVVLSNCLTSGYSNGELGVITKIEKVGQLFKLYWVFMSDGIEVPMWDSELEVFHGDRRLSDCDDGVS